MAALARDADLIATLSSLSAEETAQTSRQAIDLGRRDAAERIASLILSLAGRLNERGMMRDQSMDFPLRQHHIADAAGLTVVHVGNTLGEFRRKGLLDINDRTLTILNPEALRQVARC
jgi:CRP-like cAMP-binding protein